LGISATEKCVGPRSSEVRHCPIEDFVENDVHLSLGERCATVKFIDSVCWL